MNTSRNENTSMDNISLLAVISCVLSAGYLLLTSILA
jgi:hypothetical protein